MQDVKNVLQVLTILLVLIVMKDLCSKILLVLWNVKLLKPDITINA